MQTLARDRFPDRLKSGQLDTVVKGPSAQTLKLKDQYKMAQQGDVARRLDLQKNVKNVVNVKNTTHITNVTNVTNNYHHADHYRGRVHPRYSHGCFEFNYCGPHFFAGACWYPTWNPWVDWSWHYHCHPVWDPRPIWCRPVIYEPCPVWIYYEVPVWRPLPVVASGTWVDAPPPATSPVQSDLQLMAVRFVDPGHPEEKLGPRYRIWFRNNSGQAITQAFNVVTVGSLDGKMAQGLPQAGVRVTAVEAGDIQSVDVRLPVEVYAMGRDAQDKALSYTTLHILLDGNREVPEGDRANNGASLPLADVLPVDPAAFEIDPAQAPPDGELILAGEGFGPEPGRVLVQVDGQELDGEIVGWYDLGVKFRMPNLAVAGPTPAEVIAIRGDGAAANPLKVTVLPQ